MTASALRAAVHPLARGEVHVWTLDLGAATTAPDAHVLSADERARAARFRRPADRTRSIAARVALRRLLAGYCGASPAALRFELGPNGKPALAPAFADGAPHFNVAHSGRLVLLAFADCAVGVDVEEVRPGVDVVPLARRFFSPDETAAVLAAPPAERAPTFFRIWTRKEAFVKACGAGLSAPLDRISTTSASGTALASVEAVERIPAGHLADLLPASGYAGAVVTAEEARVTTLRPDETFYVTPAL
jgi:4'-phosphopantetheinyl transferase